MKKQIGIQFTAQLYQFEEQGEKTGWTYIIVPGELAEELRPGSKKSFRVKGALDNYAIKTVAVMPMGNGDFILPFNKDMRQGTRKKKGAMVQVSISLDTDDIALPNGFAECLADEPAAKKFFDEMRPSHRNYFIKWMQGVKSEAAQAKRIAMVITALLKKQDFGEMIRANKKQ
jgi:hypothetical protein